MKQKILYVGTLVEEAIANAISALINRDAVMAKKVIANDAVIDRMEVEVEEECLKILALYQPVANDLRFVVATLKINNDLERMGDLAKNIAKRTSYLAGADPMEVPVDFRSMAMQAQLPWSSKASTRLRERRRRLGPPGARRRRRSRHESRTSASASKCLAAIRRNPERTEFLLKFNSVAKHLERLADMATNVAEDVIYMVEGEIVRHQTKEVIDCK